MTTIRVNAKQYEDHDDCLQAAAAAVAAELGLEGWDLAPRWEDNQRNYILLEVPDTGRKELTDKERQDIQLNASGEDVWCGDYHSALEIARNACASEDWSEAACDEAAAIAMQAWRETREEE